MPVSDPTVPLEAALRGWLERLGGALETRYGASEVVGENLARLTAMAKVSLAARPHAATVLDLGVNLGYTAACLRTAYGAGGATLVGLEHPSRSLLGSRAWAAMRREVGLLAVGGDAFALPFREDAFDVVFAGEILEHLSPTELLSRFFPEVQRVLGPGGVLCVSTPNFACALNRILFLCWGRTSMDLPVPQDGRTFGHVREYTAEELGALIQAAGLEVLASGTADRRRGWVRGRPLVRLVDALEHHLGRARPGLRGFIVLSARPAVRGPG
jgi:SAM-dependent methyltransferase